MRAAPHLEANGPLTEVDTSSRPDSECSPLENVMREDVDRPGISREALAKAPLREGETHLRVPVVLKEGREDDARAAARRSDHR